MQDYLKPTEIVDWKHPAVIGLAHRLSRDQSFDLTKLGSSMAEGQKM